MNLEFVDEATDDQLDVERRRRVPRWMIGLVVTAVAAVAVVVVQRNPATNHRPSASPSSDVVAAPMPASLAALDETFTAVYESARDATPAHDILRTGTDATSCMGVRIGTAPERNASAALVRGLPGYTLLDSSRVIDEGAGLCALEVRARDTSGTVALIMVSSPSASRAPHLREALETHSALLGNIVVEYARFTTPDGWMIVVGTSGPMGRQPPARLLEDLAISSALRW